MSSALCVWARACPKRWNARRTCFRRSRCNSCAKAKSGATTVKVGYLHTIAVDDKLWLGQAEGQWAKAGLNLKTTAFDTGIDSGAASAEEAAVHVTDDPNGPGTGPEL